MALTKWFATGCLAALAALASCTGGSNAGGGEKDDSDDCPRGSEGCLCDNGSCEGALRCLSNRCVADTGSGGANPTGGSGGVSGSSGAGANGGVSGSSGAGGMGGASGVSGSASGGSSAGSGGTTEEGGPVFLTFSVNTMLLEYRQTLTVTAVLTDPDGIDDLIGGTLLDAESGGTYGSFAVAAAEGSYSLSLTWEQLNTTHSIEALPIGVERTFRAQFFDSAGHSATRDLTVRLRCNDPGTQAFRGCCAGVATDVNSSVYPTAYCGLVNTCRGCGSCGRQCMRPAWSDTDTTGGSSWCSGFRCVATKTCSAMMTCQACCASIDTTCIDPGMYIRSNEGYAAEYAGRSRYSDNATSSLATCAATPAATSTNGGTFVSVSCTCSDEQPPEWVPQLAAQ
jgi:hypothetical protein